MALCGVLAVPPLFVIEFLHRVVDTFVDYFGDCTEFLIKEHYVVVYEVRDMFSLLIGSTASGNERFKRLALQNAVRMC